MGLKDLVIPTETIKTSGGEFTVRGLSFTDILQLAGKYFPIMSELFDQFAGASIDNISEAQKRGIAATLVREAPDAVAEVIALASGEMDAETIAIAKSLTGPTQIEALNKIGRLTFVSEDDLGKAVAAVVQMMQGAGKTIAHLHNVPPA